MQLQQTPGEELTASLRNLLLTSCCIILPVTPKKEIIFFRSAILKSLYMILTLFNSINISTEGFAVFH